MGADNCIAINQSLKAVLKTLAVAALCQTECTTLNRKREECTRLESPQMENCCMYINKQIQLGIFLLFMSFHGQ